MTSVHARNWMNFRITDEDRRRLTPGQIRRLEELARKMQNDEFPAAPGNDADRFDARDMQPMDGPPPPWQRRPR